MKELSKREKISKLVASICTGIGLLLVVYMLIMGDFSIAEKSPIVIIAKCYVSLVPIICILLAVIRRKNIVLTSILFGILFLFDIWLLILPMMHSIGVI